MISGNRDIPIRSDNPNQHSVDDTLDRWPYDSAVLSATIVATSEGPELLNVQTGSGWLQMQTEDRPDGERPGRHRTYLDYLQQIDTLQDEPMLLDATQQLEVDRELALYHQRTASWQAIGRNDRVIHDTDHALKLLDFIESRVMIGRWLIAHQEYRHQVLAHQSRAAAMIELDRNAPTKAIDRIHEGLDRFRRFHTDVDELPRLHENQFARTLIDLKHRIMKAMQSPPSIHDLLIDALHSDPAGSTDSINQADQNEELRDRIAMLQQPEPWL